MELHKSRAEELEDGAAVDQQALVASHDESLGAMPRRAEPVGLASVGPVAPSGHSLTALSAAERRFGHQLVECGPGLRAYGRSLSGGQDLAEDLVQETMLRAWKARASFEPGSNLQAWTRVILRNVFLSGRRRSRFVGEWDDRIADRKLISAATQLEQIELTDVARALDRLPEEQREAVLLFGVEGLSIEEIAVATAVATGTVKSRIGRGRAAIKSLLAHESALGTRIAAAQAGTSSLSDKCEAIALQRSAAARVKRRRNLHARRALGMTLIG
ncbi:sigma-70 family RNA polymerase sigma factor [Blastomonas sp.]|uniref:sigma-70 family RNA polymerase sigma factor n=1 Tax=Blastomonas sp. TaxID=1909299 RepID=UPI00261DBE54|nr:sigma-70 family RNA polymerase sigma factor [Blastomonas sp.]MDM7957989.1 sigma-70 family RNA polymerase sigma factor [Blastomonas sp.]